MSATATNRSSARETLLAAAEQAGTPCLVANPLVRSAAPKSRKHSSHEALPPSLGSEPITSSRDPTPWNRKQVSRVPIRDRTPASGVASRVSSARWSLGGECSDEQGVWIVVRDLHADGVVWSFGRRLATCQRRSRERAGIRAARWLRSSQGARFSGRRSPQGPSIGPAGTCLWSAHATRRDAYSLSLRSGGNGQRLRCPR